MPADESIRTPSQHVQLHRQAGLATYPGDFSDSESFRYGPTGYSNHREREYLHGSTPSPLLVPYLLIRRLDQEYGQGTQSCEAEKIAKGVLASCMDFVFRITRRFAFTFIYSRFRYCKFSVEPHLYHGHTFFSCVYDSLSSNQQQWGLCQTRRIFPTLGITW